ncbi:MAG TPA: hypothetical protein VJ486_07725 [Geothrix sp.]|nr:hypothetical protein [Geothrix sp.]
MLVCVIGSAIALAGEVKPLPYQWGELPAGIWSEAKDSPDWTNGAVVLEDRVRINVEPNIFERTYRVRITRAAGRRVAEIQKWIGNIYQLEARVSYPDGSSVTFNKENDFSQKTLLGYRGFEIQRTILTPPGITSDCVYELHFKSNVKVGFQGIEEIYLGGPFPTKSLVLEVGRSGGFSALVIRPSSYKSQTVKADNSLTTTISDLPAIPESIPYESGSNEIRPRVILYTPQMGVDTGSAIDLQSFWSSVAKSVWKPWYEFPDQGKPFLAVRNHRLVIVTELIFRGPKFKALASEMLKNLPEGDQEAAKEIFRRLQKRIRNFSHLSPSEEKAFQAKDIDLSSLDERSLERAIELGGTHSAGWRMFYLQLLWAKGIHPRLVKVISIHHRPFNMWLRTASQFEWTVLCIPEMAKEPLWVDSDLRFSPVGSIPVWCQGTAALSVDTSTWDVSRIQVPWQGPNDQQASYDYQVDEHAGLLKFEISASFPGSMGDQVARTTYLPFDAQGRGTHLRKALEGTNLETSISEAWTSDPTDESKPFTWVAKGASRMPTGPRILLPPFLDLPDVIDIQNNLPLERKLPIYLGAPRKLTATSRVHIPEGYHWRIQAPLRFQNDLGLVSWEASEDSGGRFVRVRMETQLEKGDAPASNYSEFRRFLTWIQTARDRKLIFERDA